MNSGIKGEVVLKGGDGVRWVNRKEQLDVIRKILMGIGVFVLSLARD